MALPDKIFKACLIILPIVFLIAQFRKNWVMLISTEPKTFSKDEHNHIKKDRVPELVCNNGIFHISESQKAETLKNYFSIVFTTECFENI